MNKLELIDKIAKELELTIKDTSNVVNLLFKYILEDINNGNNVTISNFGTFSRSFVKAHDLFNPKTGETIHVKDNYRINFKPSKNKMEK